jgi:hypothetical protein
MRPYSEAAIVPNRLAWKNDVSFDDDVVICLEHTGKRKPTITGI